MTDLVDRLRSALPTHREDWDGFDPIMAEAADEIEWLRERCAAYKDQADANHEAAVEAHAEIDRLRAALSNLADAADDVGVQFFDTDTMHPLVEKMQTATQAARAALGEPKP